MFSREKFAKWAADYVLFLHVTSWVYTDPHHDLFSDRGGVGTPYVTFLDAEGGLLAVAPSGLQTTAALQKTAEAAAELHALTQRANAGDTAARAAVFGRRLALEGLSFAEAQAEYAQVRDAIPADRHAAIEQRLVNREIADALAAVRRAHPGQGPEFRRAVATRAVAFFRDGKVPTNALASHYFDALLGAARSTGDRALFDAGLRRLVELAADQPRLQGRVERFERARDQWPGARSKGRGGAEPMRR